MRRILGILLLILVVGVVLTPPLIGQLAKYNIKTEIQNAALPAGASIKILDYHAGWFRSTARLQLSLPNAIKFANDFLFRLDINHGPIAYTTNIDGKPQWFFGQAIIKGISENLPGNLTADAYLHFTNRVDVVYKLSALQTDLQQTNQTALKNFSGNISLYNNFQNFATQLNIDDLHVKYGFVDVVIHNAVSNSKGSRTAAGLWTEDRTIVIPSVNIQTAQQNLLLLTDVTIQSQLQAAPDNRTLNFLFNTVIKSLNLYATQPLGPLTLKLSVAGINRPAVAALKQLTRASSSAVKSSDGINQVLPWLQNYVNLLQGIKVNLETLEVVTPQGNINGNAYFSLPQQITASNPLALALSFVSMTLNTQGELNIKIPEAFINSLTTTIPNNEISATVQKWQASGFLRKENDNLVTNFKYQRGRILLNDVPLS